MKNTAYVIEEYRERSNYCVKKIFCTEEKAKVYLKENEGYSVLVMGVWDIDSGERIK